VEQERGGSALGREGASVSIVMRGRAETDGLRNLFADDADPETGVVW